MIVKPSTLINTFHVRQIAKTVSVEEMDKPLAYQIDPVVLRYLDELPVKVTLCPADGLTGDGNIYGFTTMDLDTYEPAIILQYTYGTTLYDFITLMEHELIHVQQVRDGRLRYSDPDDTEHVIWEGVKTRVFDVPSLDCDYTVADGMRVLIAMMQYHAQPWETEAVNCAWHRVFGGCLWPFDVVKQYGTIWPAHWSAKYVYKRMLILQDIRKLMKEFAEEGY